MCSFLYGKEATASLKKAEPLLKGHLETTYGVSAAVTQLEGGAPVRVDLEGGGSWVARVFPQGRPLAAAEGDATVLRFLAESGFPAERLVVDPAVTELEGHAVLVTGYVEGKAAGYDAATLHRLGELLGRLHCTPTGPSAVERKAGALHLWSVRGGGFEENLEAAWGWLQAAKDRVAPSQRALYETVTQRVTGSDSGHGLPEAFIHPDFQPGNAIQAADDQLVVIDWAGAGRGPRAVSLAVLLWLAVNRSPAGKDLASVDAVMAGYLSQARPEDEELVRLPGIMQAADLVLDCFYFGMGWKPLSVVVDQLAVTARLAEAMGQRVRQLVAASNDELPR